MFIVSCRHWKVPVIKKVKHFLSRSVAKLSNQAVRKRFLDYFINENEHTFIPSSPVVPWNDKSVAYVNAGMNQFKNIFLGQLERPCLRAANSQKCIRVGGKHNDLCDVGNDSYHHTFFEMLGNWSFGDYYKKEACELAWQLLTSHPYSLDPSRLYVTYFGGDKSLNLPPDLETRDIWKSIGVKPDHILPFGVTDNFWEMGNTGPCGPCTEIHIDHRGSNDAVTKINKGFDDVTELWNLVFIQFNRNEDGSLSPLPAHYVDTGLGFERLVAVLQGKQSNYDTDLFEPLFNTISEASGFRKYSGQFGEADIGGIDRAYRIVADHTRMATVAIADKMYPDHNHKLRRILRKCLLLSEESFKMKNGANLVKEVSNKVSEILSSVYPEIKNNLKQVHAIIDYEREILTALKCNTGKQWQDLCEKDPRLCALTGYEASALPAAFCDISSVLLKHGHSVLPGEFAVQLYDRHGLNPDLIEELCDVLGLTFRRSEFDTCFENLKEKNRNMMAENSLAVGLPIPEYCVAILKEKFPVTNDVYKYNYTRTVTDSDEVTYSLPEMTATIQAIITKGKVNINHDAVDVSDKQEVILVLDRTCFYSEAGGQESDRGRIIVNDDKGRVKVVFDINRVDNHCGYILHHGHVSSLDTNLSNRIGAGTEVTLKLDKEWRLGNMRNHTATHLINGILHKMLTVTCQKSSKVTKDTLQLDFGVYGEAIDTDYIRRIEEDVQNIIKAKIPVSRNIVSSTKLMEMPDVTLLPGEVYPIENISLIEIENNGVISKEACCGTHVKNTYDIGGMIITSLSSLGPGVKSITATTGPRAHHSLVEGQRLLADAKQLTSEVERTVADKGSDQVLSVVDKLQVFRNRLSSEANSSIIPYCIQCEITGVLNKLMKQIKDTARTSLRQSLEEEMKDLLNNNKTASFIVHFLKCSSHLDKVPLQKATKLCQHLPIIVFAYSESNLRARCCVPQNRVDNNATAESWLQPVLSALGGTGGPPKGQNPQLVYNMKALRIPQDKVDKVVEKALMLANNEAKKLFN